MQLQLESGIGLLRPIFRLATQNSNSTHTLEHVPVNTNLKLEHCLVTHSLSNTQVSKLIVFKHVSQPFFTKVDSQADGKNVILTNFIKKGDILLFCLLPSLWKLIRIEKTFEPPHDKTNKMTYAPSEDRPV